MFKNLLLSFAGIGGIAVVPFSLFFSKEEGASLYSNKELLIDNSQEKAVDSISRPSLETIKAISNSSRFSGGGVHGNRIFLVALSLLSLLKLKKLMF